MFLIVPKPTRESFGLFSSSPNLYIKGTYSDTVNLSTFLMHT